MYKKRKRKPVVGDVKAKTKFLLFPRWTEKEFAWLCKARLTYIYGEFGYDEPFSQWDLIKIEQLNN